MTGFFSTNPKIQEIHNMRKQLRKLVKQKQHDDALKLGLEILQKAPYEQNVLFIVGGIYYMKNQYKTAMPYFEKALDIGAYDVEVLTLKANAHYFLGEPKKALACCEKIKEIDPKNKTVAELISKIK